MKLGYSGLKENQKKKLYLRYLEGNDAFVSLYTQIICWIQFYLHPIRLHCVNFLFYVYIVYFAINCFNSGMTCFEDGLCNTRHFPGKLTSLEQ